jgi:protein-S-isoprenylcysteine O-methyltransferase Ste14
MWWVMRLMATSESKTMAPSFLQIMLAVRRREVLFNVPVHVCILIPATSVIAYLATRLDALFGLERFLSWPMGLALFCILFPLGVFIVWYTYGYLAIMGDGSPATHLGGTKNLVTTGIFAVCRHPSIIGKFLGVVGFGFLVGSPIFFFIIIPGLTTYSLLAVRFLQERLCVKLWGDDYLAYRKSTPLILPRLIRR